MKLLQFNDNYFKLESICSEIRNAREISKNEPVKEVSKEQKTAGELYIRQLENNYKELTKSLKNARLLKELESVKTNLTSRYQNVLKSGNTGEVNKVYRQT